MDQQGRERIRLQVRPDGCQSGGVVSQLPPK
jgi:hypothetical protein